ncbi:MAG: ABC transporter permease [Ruminococcus sp.]|nr:ABC transporter permease [Ruminococcus sp.]
MKLLRAEFKKLRRLGLLPLVLLLAVGLRVCLCLLPRAREHPYSVEVYRRYCNELQGELTEEKLACLNTRRQEIEELLAAYDEMQTRYARGELTLEEYSNFNRRHGLAQAEAGTVYYLCEKCARLEECRTFDRQIFFDTDWAELFEDSGTDLVLLLALLCIAVPAFDREYSTGSFRQLLTSKRGRAELAAAKLMAVCSSAAVLSLLLSGARLLVFFHRCGAVYHDLPAGNVLLSDGTGSLSLLGYYLTDAALKALTAAMYSAAACLVSILCRSTAFSFSLSFLATATPLLVLKGTESPRIAYFLAAAVWREMYRPELPPPIFAAVTAIKMLLLSAAAAALWSSVRDSRA